MSSIAVDILGAVVGLIGFAATVSQIYVLRKALTRPPEPKRPVGRKVLRDAAGLLPGAAAARYAEEWQGELFDMRAEGEPLRRRFLFTLVTTLYVAPLLAVRLRLRRNRVAPHRGNSRK